MKTTIVIGLLLIAAFIIFMSSLAKSQRKADVVHAKSALLSTYSDVQRGESLTNSWNLHTQPHTNQYVVDGVVYQSVLAADSWDYQSFTNLLVLTSDKKFLYIDRHGVTFVSNWPPGY